MERGARQVGPSENKALAGSASGSLVRCSTGKRSAEEAEVVKRGLEAYSSSTRRSSPLAAGFRKAHIEPCTATWVPDKVLRLRNLHLKLL